MTTDNTLTTPLTLAAALLGSSYFLYCKLLKSAKLALPNGYSIDRQAVPVKGQPGVWKSALLENQEEDVLTTFYPEVTTLHDVFLRGKKVSNDGPCAADRSGDEYDYVNYNDIYEQSKQLAMALVHEFGLKPANSTNIGIYARNSPQWLASSLACIGQSIVVVPLYDTLGPEAASFIISQAEISVVIVDSMKKADSLIKNRENMPNLKTIVVIAGAELKDGPTTIDNIRVETFESALQLGAAYPYTPNLPKRDDVYIICYTSGTTGTPKGVVLTHGNVVANVSGFLKILDTFKPELMNPKQNRKFPTELGREMFISEKARDPDKTGEDKPEEDKTGKNISKTEEEIPLIAN
uniref:long-chain-fatty-acid--CoA ligase n=2 Tax=Caenorhabditis japonica TaxID=281687 RepID=A0A8R1E6U4_CAEJA